MAEDTSGNQVILGSFSSGSGARFIWALATALSAIWTEHPVLLVGLIAANILVLLARKIDFRDLFRVFRYVIWLVLFLFVLHLFSHRGEALFSLWGVDATREGAIAGLLYGLKLLAFAYAGVVIFKTVDPIELVSPLERLARRLGSAGRFLSSFALTFFLALRFLPEFSSQARMTMMSFKSRGIDAGGGLIRKARAASYLIAPIFVNAIKRAEMATAALNIKGYTTRHLRADLGPAHLSLAGAVLTALALGAAVLGWYLR